MAIRQPDRQTMKQHRLILLMLMTMLAGMVSAQNLITGVVYDASSEQPLDYANVVVYRGGEGVQVGGQAPGGAKGGRTSHPQ